MIAPRTGHTATKLNDAPGRVLIAGGSPSFDPTTGVFTGSLASAELFDPRSGGQFEQLPFQMNVARSGQAATLLADGAVLITGGVDQQGLVQATAEIFKDPSVRFAPAGVMNSERFFHGSILLPGGTVLIAGGVDGAHNVLASAEIYNPARNTFTLTSNAMKEPRQSPATTMLSDGRVLIAAGSGDDSAEIYDPASQTFTLIAGPGTQRLSATATSLGGSNVLVAGGFQLLSPPGQAVEATNPQAELIDTSSNSFLPTGSMVNARAYHTATFLDPNFVQGPLSGMVLIAGGKSLNPPGTTNGDAQLYDPHSGTLSGTGAMNEARALATATVLKCPGVTGCPDGQVLLAGGFVFSMEALGSLASAELYNPDPAVRSFSATGALTSARFSATATSLAGGRVLVAGGLQVQTGTQTLVALDSAEIYDPVMGAFTCVGGAGGNPPSCNSSMSAARALHAATALADGTVLLTGGFVVNSSGSAISTSSIPSAEIFDPQTGSFAPTAGPMNEARAGHTATFLDPKLVSGSLAGKVLIAGGTNDLSAEVYDPGSGRFTRLQSIMNSVHSFHTATLLRNGRVLIAGGGSNNFFALLTGANFVAEPIAEIFDPPTGTFVLANEMVSARALQTATFLDPALVSGKLAGDVLVTGGASTNSTLAGTELFVPSDPPTTCKVCAQ